MATKKPQLYTVYDLEGKLEHGNYYIEREWKLPNWSVTNPIRNINNSGIKVGYITPAGENDRTYLTIPDGTKVIITVQYSQNVRHELLQVEVALNFRDFLNSNKIKYEEFPSRAEIAYVARKVSKNALELAKRLER